MNDLPGRYQWCISGKLPRQTFCVQSTKNQNAEQISVIIKYPKHILHKVCIENINTIEQCKMFQRIQILRQDVGVVWLNSKKEINANDLFRLEPNILSRGSLVEKTYFLCLTKKKRLINDTLTQLI